MAIPEMNELAVNGGNVFEVVDEEARNRITALEEAGYATEEDVTEKLENLEENGTVANAEELVSSRKVNNKIPYLFRATPRAGDRAYFNAVVGSSVVENQLIQNGNFADTSGWTTYTSYFSLSVANNIAKITINDNTTSQRPNLSRARVVAPIVGHIYLLRAMVKITTASTSSFGMGIFYDQYKAFNSNRDVPKNEWFEMSVLLQYSSGSSGIVLYCQSNATYFNAGDTIEYKEFYGVDLTAFFGSVTIPNYLLTLDNATANSAISKLREWGFDFSNLDYTQNTLKSIEGLEAHKTTGLNQWDEQWELGSYNASGNKVNSTTTIRSKNKCQCLPSTAYKINFTNGVGGVSRMCFYDINGVHLAGKDIASASFTTPSDAYYYAFVLNATYGTTYKNDICIFIHHDSSMDGTYEPYWERTYPLDDSITLRGIYKLDSSNNLYADGDVYPPSGEVTRKRGRMNLGEQNWTYYTSGTNPIFYLSVHTADAKVYSRGNTVEVICQNYPVGLTATARSNIAGSTGLPDKSCTWMEGSDGKFVIRDSSYTDAASLKAALANVYMEYELATPTTEEASPYTSPQRCDNWGTEEFITSQTNPIPIGHDTDYPISLKDKIESYPDLPSANGTYLLKMTNGEASWVAHS